MSNVARVAGQAANTLVKPLEVEQLFSTYLYDGNGASPTTITNDIDLSGEGGMVWTKNRDSAINHNLTYTDQPSNRLFPNTTDAADTGGNNWSYASNGYTVTGNNDNFNGSGVSYASWTFRKALKFFDVVTYTGDGTTNRQISHNLGSTPASIIVKCTSVSTNWVVYHKDLTNADYCLLLNSTSAEISDSTVFGTAPTDTVFTVARTGVSSNTNQSGATYVAYLFAHNDGDGNFGPNGNADSIKCGSYTGNGSATGPVIDLGFEPQWVLIKETSATGNWQLFDSMRGMVADGSDARITPNLNSAEDSIQSLTPTATGFNINTTSGNMNTNNSNHIYIAIRRPTAVPESATEVFDANQTTSNQFVTTGFPVDLQLGQYTGGGSTYVVDRMRGMSTSTTGSMKYLTTQSTNAEASNTGSLGFNGFVQNGFSHTLGNFEQALWSWKRAPKYFDVVAYTGNGTAGRTVSHNLGVAPEMMWVKRRDSTGHWYVYHTGMTGGSDALHSTARLNLTEAGFDTQSWKNYDFTAAHFSLDNGADINGSGGTYIAYLFATLAGISKVGSYTGNGSSQTIDCGFSAGARFVLIKKTSGTGSWLVYDTERGIVAGNDSQLYLDGTFAADSYDNIDPDNSGFIATGATNTSGETYIFYAIA